MQREIKIKTFNIGILGCGAIGRKRASAISDRATIVGCADIDLQRAENLALKHNSKAYRNWQDLVGRVDVDAVFISTLHDSLVEISLGAIRAGKHVLVEKPASRNAAELTQVAEALRYTSLKYRVGFNHRYHRALLKAKSIVDTGALGNLMFIRGRYGHGGRVGYEKEWRAEPLLSGGGELRDQGPHLIDLSRWFLGDFVEVRGEARNYYWNMRVDDNAFIHLKTIDEKTAFLHVSCTEWKNTFSLEIYGTNGKIEVSGLGGSYGTERVTWFNMLSEMGPPETICWEYPMADNSWRMETEAFFDDIEFDRQPSAGMPDALACQTIIDKIYIESGYDYCT